MKIADTLRKIVRFYREGFSEMETGKTLWAVIIVKLIIIFVILNFFFMPNTLKTNAVKGKEADYVESQLMRNTRQ